MPVPSNGVLQALAGPSSELIECFGGLRAKASSAAQADSAEPEETFRNKALRKRLRPVELSFSARWGYWMILDRSWTN